MHRNNAGGWAVRAGLAGLIALLGAANGFAQSGAAPSPLPSVAPLPPVPPKEGPATTQSAAPRSDNSPASNFSLSQLFGQTRQGTTIALTDAQRSAVQRVNTYFNSITTLVGNFVQIGPDRQRLEGEFYMQKPGKVRFDYDPPSPVELISDGSSIVVRDRKLATQDLYPLSQTPLRFLLAEKLDLLKDTNVVAVHQDDLFVSVVIEEKHPVVGTHRLMIMFGAKDSELKQWTITDPQGYDTTVAVFNLDQKSKPDPGLFRIEYTRME
ncbi:MAG: outer-membrane lipoprotein carrier protein LolA [Bradyrhizobiaceae bacterium]|nr:outer-membrane lipoprotein carrier protein LolA [Bradyrhizobiaceae bacterium]